MAQPGLSQIDSMAVLKQIFSITPQIAQTSGLDKQTLIAIHQLLKKINAVIFNNFKLPHKNFKDSWNY